MNNRKVSGQALCAIVMAGALSAGVVGAVGSAPALAREDVAQAYPLDPETSPYARASAEERAAMKAQFEQLQRTFASRNAQAHMSGYEQLARKGYPDALAAIGSSYQFGTYGYRKDLKRARRLILASVEAGSTYGMHGLASMVGIPESDVKFGVSYKSVASMQFWHLEAARKGNRGAQVQVGMRNFESQTESTGGVSNADLAYYWLMRAHENAAAAGDKGVLSVTESLIGQLGHTVGNPPLSDFPADYGGTSVPAMRELELARVREDRKAVAAAQAKLEQAGLSEQTYLANLGVVPQPSVAALQRAHEQRLAQARDKEAARKARIAAADAKKAAAVTPAVAKASPATASPAKVQEAKADAGTYAQVMAAITAKDMNALQDMREAGIFKEREHEGHLTLDYAIAAVQTKDLDVVRLVASRANQAQTFKPHTRTLYHLVEQARTRAMWASNTQAAFDTPAIKGTYEMEFLRKLKEVLRLAGADTSAQDRYKLTAYDLAEQENNSLWEKQETHRTGLNRFERARQAAAKRKAERAAQARRWEREQAESRRRGAARVAALRAQTADFLGQMSRNTTSAAQYERDYRQRLARNRARSRQQAAPSSSSSSSSSSPSSRSTSSSAAPSSNRSRTALTKQPTRPSQTTAGRSSSVPSRTTVSRPTPARSSSSSSSSSSTSRAPDWSGSALSACYREAERTRTMGPSDGLKEAIKAFKIGCDVVHLLEFSTAGTDRVYCGKSGDFPAKAQGRLADAGLRGYLPYAQRAWNVWVNKRGCM
ncbi:hypothetical protein [Novosphingobium mangrovi (ex Hu et al. 2023)]|uniref:Sel1 repeat family protein n=1 Tax=Novosphingobium mangrovi (ex Hu et al. 2023) TaxID=2930094 RepID=A0ABT0AIB6_9SPHN|nr:hypothetical protein [Novosphingobium mangrovi (ex Hu et al. 2023)]MCJ1962880.1 hypothetical protein [Novosphingobium mangrovi (ex Hu et al. 2023)]